MITSVVNIFNDNRLYQSWVSQSPFMEEPMGYKEYKSKLIIKVTNKTTKSTKEIIDENKKILESVKFEKVEVK
ncbi:hypothetical protein QJR30_07645 [Paraclostridium sordellii]|uniref:hypothetical protein n=1 Tax=Paraclostridium sordellii TaxID=1505 RepID=UPI0030D07A0F